MATCFQGVHCCRCFFWSIFVSCDWWSAVAAVDVVRDGFGKCQEVAQLGVGLALPLGVDVDIDAAS